VVVTKGEAMTKAYETWQDRLDSGRLTKAQVQQFAAVVSRVAEGLDRQGKASALTDDECRALAARIFNNPVLLTAEHTEQGYEWLTRYGRKLHGIDQSTLQHILSTFKCFTWRGEIELSGSLRGQVPIWHVHLNDGREFAYFWAAWQGAQGFAMPAMWEITPAFYGEDR
jgi:hypothetical protein